MAATKPKPRAYIIVALESKGSGFEVVDINSGVPLEVAARALGLAQEQVVANIMANAKAKEAAQA